MTGRPVCERTESRPTHWGRVTTLVSLVSPPASIALAPLCAPPSPLFLWLPLGFVSGDHQQETGGGKTVHGSGFPQQVPTWVTVGWSQLLQPSSPSVLWVPLGSGTNPPLAALGQRLQQLPATVSPRGPHYPLLVPLTAFPPFFGSPVPFASCQKRVPGDCMAHLSGQSRRVSSAPPTSHLPPPAPITTHPSGARV